MHVHCVQRASAATRTQTATWFELAMANLGKDDAPLSARYDALRSVWLSLHAISFDQLQSALSMYREALLYDGVELMRVKFQEKLGDSEQALQRSTAWLGAAVRAAVSASVVSADDLKQSLPGAFRKVVCTAWTDLVTLARDSNEVPELLRLERTRLASLARSFEACVLAGAVLVTLDQFVRSCVAAEMRTRVRESIANVVQRACVSRDAETLVYAVMRVLVDSRCMQPSDVQTAVALASKHCKKDHPVFGHISKMYRAYWLDIVCCEGSAAARSPDVGGETGELLLASMRTHAALLRKLVELNCRIHSPRYNQLIAEAASCLSSE